MRFSIRRVLLSSVLVVFLTACYFGFNPIPHLHGFFGKSNSISGFERTNLAIRKQIHYSNYLFSGYNDFTKLYQNKIQTIVEAPLEDKCDQFFKLWSQNNPDWSFRTFEETHHIYNKGITNKKQFYENSVKKIREERKLQDITREDNRTIEIMFKSEVRQTKEIGVKMADTVSIMRLYGTCFLDSHGNTRSKEIEGESKDLFNRYTDKLFPYFNKQVLPEFFSVNLKGAIPANTIPKYDKENHKYTGENISYNTDETNFIDFMNKNTNGKGIVISAATRYSKDLVKLIRILRALNNRLPIQIIYKSDINKKSKEAIVMAATESLEELLGTSSSPEFMNIMPEYSLMEKYKEFGSEFPKQDLWFVNIAKCISHEYKYAFPSFSNRLLAMVFSSFKEVILMDADTVPMIPVEDFFKIKEYVETGTLFFQDRSLRDTNDYMETNFFTTIFPSNEKSLETLFKIPLVTSKTLGNKYMTGWRHYMEAGVVAYDKSRHFLGTLMTMPLCLWKEPVKSSIWGDKEMYWMGLAMAGDENYAFNELPAASVGELTVNRDHKYYPNSTTSEVCSSHPGHIYKETSKLLWINSGFSFCKKNGHHRDRTKFPFTVFDKDLLKSIYDNPLKLSGAIIPPDLPPFRAPFSPPDPMPEIEFRETWNFRKPDTDELDKENGNSESFIIRKYGPQKGWVKNGICAGYQYCAYNVVSSYLEEDQDDVGYVFEFDTEDTKRFEYLSKIWLTGTMQYIPAPPPEDKKKVQAAAEVKAAIPEDPKPEPPKPASPPAESPNDPLFASNPIEKEVEQKTAEELEKEAAINKVISQLKVSPGKVVPQAD